MINMPSPKDIEKIIKGELLSSSECKIIYDNMIENSRKRILNKTIHEKHHIIPKCLGGSRSSKNLAVLFYDEHYYAHVLLIRIYDNNPEIQNQMLASLHKVTVLNGKQAARFPKEWQINLGKFAIQKRMMGNLNLLGHTWTLTPEQCSAISARLIGNKYGIGNQNAKGKNLLSNNGRATPVKCLDDGKIYQTIKEASNAYGVNAAKIGSVCRGERNKTGGMRFEYIL